MTEPTEEARAELNAINDELSYAFGSNLAGNYANAIMLALDRHHGRTPPDPMVAKAGRLIESLPYWVEDRLCDQERVYFIAELKRMFPDG